ncbi:MAG: hypothetical protein US52_C0022G0006 [candidate division WS6 bacterium GW2011_GWA2_37_6]|uniref:Uncharacterized protein n=1 Tax=candidate division WS6 bacterium GW2011_GWA2_37_6 TaxID=1619087 RepID=A0A0G0GZY0_9BACT|nr:MAG: hypothetical protein US52_C0022G0006 [candidate division WS6 bacterium GW2011_GWA2_37_6]
MYGPETTLKSGQIRFANPRTGPDSHIVTYKIEFTDGVFVTLSAGDKNSPLTACPITQRATLNSPIAAIYIDPPDNKPTLLTRMCYDCQENSVCPLFERAAAHAQIPADKFYDVFEEV